MKKVATVTLFGANLALGRAGKGLVVPTYHRVTMEPEPGDPLIVSAPMFERQVRFLRDNYSIVSGDDLVDAIGGDRPLPDKACLITFDDGWADNYSIAWPILRRLGLTGVIFLATDYIGTGRRFWYARLRDLASRSWVEIRHFWAASNDGSELSKCLREFAIAHAQCSANAFNGLVERLKQFPVSEVDVAIEGTQARIVGFSADRSRGPAMLDWSQVNEMSSHGIGFGAHGTSHAIFTRISEEDLRREVVGSKRALEQHLGREVKLIAYPNGDYDARTLKIATDAGIRAGFTCISGVNSDLERPLELRRIGMREESGVGLSGRFSPLFLSAELSGARHDLKRWAGR